MIKMNLHKKCRNCGDFFSIEKTAVIKFFCNKEECQKSIRRNIFLNRIKKARGITMDHFDIFDLDLPTESYHKYERVCRVCGARLIKKNGEHSFHKRYCNKCTGNSIWAKYDIEMITKGYARKIRDQNFEIIKKLVKEIIPKEVYKEKKRLFYNPFTRYRPELFTLCEKCGKLLRIYQDYNYYSKNTVEGCNIHHKIPVHTLDWDNIYLIWDEDNLICLCQDCHNRQDHKLKKIKKIKNRKITEFFL